MKVAIISLWLQDSTGAPSETEGEKIPKYQDLA